MAEDLLIVFTKNGQLGKVKTRLAATIGEHEALKVHRLLSEKTAAQMSGVLSDKIVYYSNDIEVGDVFSTHGFRQEIQHGDDLGQRMNKAFADKFQQGYSSIVMIGTDCPEISKEDIVNAFSELKFKNLVLGPARDGGYYLIGLSSPEEELFTGIEWSTSSVFQKTIDIAQKLQLTVGILPKKQDIDTSDDLKSCDFGKEHFPYLIDQ